MADLKLINKFSLVLSLCNAYNMRFKTTRCRTYEQLVKEMENEILFKQVICFTQRVN